MQKVITINLNGNAYQLDESAYDALRAYLERAEAALRDNPDKAEILSDLEQAIADKCGRFLGPQKSVVSASEIEHTLTDMGPVEGDASSGAAEPGGDAARPGGGATKRLYLINEGAMLGGVCTGLAAYFDVDVAIVRLLFVVFAVVTGGAGVVVYGSMVMFVPHANTSEEQAAAHGVPFNAQQLVDQAKKHYAKFASKDWKRQWKHKNRQMRREWRRAAREERRWPMSWYEYSASVPGAMLAGVMTPIFTLINLALLALLALAIYSLATAGEILGWTIPAGMPLWLAIVMLIVLYNIITSPLGAARHAVYGSFGHPALAVWGGIVWLGVLVFLLVLASNHVPEIRVFIENLPSLWREFANGFKPR